jgi:hypothetical protein
VKAWHAAWAALVFLGPPASTAADDLPGAARELARRTSGLTRGPVAATYRNLSSLPDSEIAQVRREFEAALPAGPGEPGPPAEARFTLSENASQYLLVEEFHRGEDSQVWIASWKRSERPTVLESGVALEKRLIWEQDEQILDVAILGEGLAILTPSHIFVQAGAGTARTQRSAEIIPVKPWPRDLRGRLRVNGTRIEAFLPGLGCTGSVEPALVVDCRASDEPWVLESGSRGILLANFAAERNFFDGRVVAQNGARKGIAPFYSAAAAEEQGNLLWLLALVDGRTQIFDNALEPVANIPGWGSDLVGISARCSGGSQVLATRPGDANEPDAIQAFNIVNRTAMPLAPAVTFSGPVTALWPSGPTSALAVARVPATGKYQAYVLTMVCGP